MTEMDPGIVLWTVPDSVRTGSIRWQIRWQTGKEKVRLGFETDHMPSDLRKLCRADRI